MSDPLRGGRCAVLSTLEGKDNIFRATVVCTLASCSDASDDVICGAARELRKRERFKLVHMVHVE